MNSSELNTLLDKKLIDLINDAKKLGDESEEKAISASEKLLEFMLDNVIPPTTLLRAIPLTFIQISDASNKMKGIKDAGEI